MRFYRGIAVPAADVAETIEHVRSCGLLGDEGRWRMSHSPPTDREGLLALPSLNYGVTRNVFPKIPAICASGDLEGAKHYACKHNLSADCSTAIIIELEAPRDDVAVDGKDFLYTCFQMGDPDRAHPILERAFGTGILRYAERAWAEPSSSIACCDLAIHDPDVIEAHHRNTLTLGGRNRIPLRNAFTVAAPIEASRIIGVEEVSKEYVPLTPEIMLSDILR